jgi:hypothetical protein
MNMKYLALLVTTPLLLVGIQAGADEAGPSKNLSPEVTEEIRYIMSLPKEQRNKAIAQSEDSAADVAVAVAADVAKDAAYAAAQESARQAVAFADTQEQAVQGSEYPGVPGLRPSSNIKPGNESAFDLANPTLSH